MRVQHRYGDPFSGGKVPKPNRAAIQRSRLQPLRLLCCGHISPFTHKEVRKSSYSSVMRVWGQNGGIAAMKCIAPLRSVQLLLHAGIKTHRHTYICVCLLNIIHTPQRRLSALLSHIAWATCTSRSPLREWGVCDRLQVAALRAKEIEYWH